MTCSPEPRTCQRALLASRREVGGLEVYRCAAGAFVLSGRDRALLALPCEGCVKKSGPGESGSATGGEAARPDGA